MNRPPPFSSLSFRTKVLVPVVTIMVLLVAISMWLLSDRITRQVESDASQQLASAEAVFKNTQKLRADDLFLRYRNVANEPRFKAVAGKTDVKPFAQFLGELVDGGVADVIVLATPAGQHLIIARDPRLDLTSFETNCNESVTQALNGRPKMDTVRNRDRLFDIVSLPIRVGDDVVGAVSFGTENRITHEFSQLTRSELVLVAEGRVMASTGLRPEWQPLLISEFARHSSGRGSINRNPIRELPLGDERFLCLAGQLMERNRGHQLGYLILTSYEKQLQVLRSTQLSILFISTIAILLGTTVVWAVVRRLTRPLQELRESAEAVGRGDFSRRVEVRETDECGELARAFNQMTENLKNSREQLEMTVDTMKTTQSQFIQSEKLSGIGEFIAGVAHELNNPLTSVMGFSDLLRQADDDPKRKRYLETIHKSALRCQKIVQALLTFARRRSPERKPTCVNGLIEAAIESLQYQLRSNNVKVNTRLDPGLPLALVDPHQIQQVFVNLLNNARQAIESHQPKGWIKVTTETSGDRVRVIVQDSGPGIPEENLSRIFDPFFTTKKVGEGTGLGLSLCYGTIKEHGGTIAPHSKPGEGATFIIELPITHEAGESAETSRPAEIDRPDPREGAGRKVLVIDDEEPIRQMVREALTPRGYEVDVVADGETGLQQLSRKHYDLALCDWKMPGLNGEQVYEHLRAIDPALSERIIFVTGDVISEHTRQFFAERNKVCLPKPFTLAEFRAAIRKVLAAG